MKKMYIQKGKIYYMNKEDIVKAINVYRRLMPYEKPKASISCSLERMWS